MAVASESGSVGTKPGPARSRGASGLPMDLLRRFLMLREGSIVVVTVITLIYFAATTSNYFTYSNFKSLLPYFCFLAIMAAGPMGCVVQPKRLEKKSDVLLVLRQPISK